ncbi:MAG: YabP/YqfC family sporulation protein [Oscillospiraceae bacterium]|nr:YabP/YqfC family sporulation protein [Oscillospiraceae bacterium]
MRKAAVIGPEQLYDEKLIYIHGRTRLLMEGCKKVVFCDETTVKLLCGFNVTIHGDGLKIMHLGNGNVAVDGRISSVSFSDDELRTVRE